MTTRDELHRLIDRLPEEALPEAEGFLEALSGRGDEGLPRFLAEAPWDDEPETEEERLAVAEAYEALERGDVFTLDEVRRDLGL